MQVYFFDLNVGGEEFLDEDGVAHFDEGSALYYGQMIASRIGRDPDFNGVRVQVRTANGLLLGSIDAPKPRPQKPRPMSRRQMLEAMLQARQAA